MAELWGSSSLSSETCKTLTKAFYIDRDRTPAQDIRYQFQQLTDVVVRALSPGINDPFTAINGIDELAAALLLFIEKDHVGEQRRDKEGQLRLVVPSASAAEILEDTVGHIVLYATTDHFVMEKLRMVLRSVLPALRDEQDRRAAARLQEDLDRRQKEASA